VWESEFQVGSHSQPCRQWGGLSRGSGGRKLPPAAGGEIFWKLQVTFGGF